MMGLLGLAKLEVHHNHALAVGHDAVGAALHELPALRVKSQNGAFIEECPSVAEPIGHLLVGQSAVQHGAQSGG